MYIGFLKFYSYFTTKYIFFKFQKTEKVETNPNPSLYPMAIQQGGPIFSQKQRPLKKRILNEQNGQNFLGKCQFYSRKKFLI